MIATPLRQLPGLVTLGYDPVKCRGCACILNPYCHVDFASHSWACPFWCVTRPCTARVAIELPRSVCSKRGQQPGTTSQEAVTCHDATTRLQALVQA